MKIKKNLIISASFLLIISLNTSGFIYQARVFRSIGHFGDTRKIFLCLSDWHRTNYPDNKMGNIQRYQLLKWAHLLNASLIIEDPYINDFDYHSEKVPMYLQSDECGLDFLEYYCKKIGLAFKNCEFRTYLSGSSRFKEMPYYPTLATLTKITEEINAYNDSKCLNNIYHRELSPIDELIKSNDRFFRYFQENKKLSLKEFLEDDTYLKSFEPEIENFIDYCKKEENIDSWSRMDQIHESIHFYANRLLELRLLHEACRAKTEIVIIYSGGFHVDNLAKFFKELKVEELQKFNQKHFSSDEPRAIELDEIFNQISKYFYSDLSDAKVPLLIVDLLWREVLFNLPQIIEAKNQTIYYEFEPENRNETTATLEINNNEQGAPQGYAEPIAETLTPTSDINQNNAQNNLEKKDDSKKAVPLPLLAQPQPAEYIKTTTSLNKTSELAITLGPLFGLATTYAILRYFYSDHSFIKKIPTFMALWFMTTIACAATIDICEQVLSKKIIEGKI